MHISCIVPTHPFSSARACCFCHPRTSCIPQQIHQHHNQCQSSPLSPPFSLLSHQVQRNAGLHLQDSKDGRRRGCIQRDRSRVVPPNHLHVHRDGEGYTHTAATFSFGCLLDFPPPSRRQHKHLLQLLALLSVHCLPIFRLAPLVARVPSPSTKAKHARQACRHNRNRARVTFPAVSSSPLPPLRHHLHLHLHHAIPRVLQVTFPKVKAAIATDAAAPTFFDRLMSGGVAGAIGACVRHTARSIPASLLLCFCTCDLPKRKGRSRRGPGGERARAGGVFGYLVFGIWH